MARAILQVDCTLEAEDMFSIYCPGHRARVLLDLSRVWHFRGDDDGYQLNWVCWCGAEGWHRIPRGAAAA
jgi:hypothetical protein